MRHDRTLLDQRPVGFESPAESFLAHSGRRANGRHGLLGIGDAERPVLAAQRAAGLKRLELFRFAVAVVSLPDVNEGRQGGVLRALRVGNPRTQMRGGYRL